jgi:hypothetical protein
MDRSDPGSMHSPTTSTPALLIQHCLGRTLPPSKHIQTLLTSHSSPQKLESTRHPSLSIQATRLDRSNQQKQQSMRSPTPSSTTQLLIRRATLDTSRNSAKALRRLTGNRASIRARTQPNHIPAPIRSRLSRRTLLRPAAQTRRIRGRIHRTQTRATFILGLARLVVGTRLTTETLSSSPVVLKTLVSRLLRAQRHLLHHHRRQLASAAVRTYIKSYVSRGPRRLWRSRLRTAS